MKFRDYYEILGVPRGAKPDEIRRAYRKLARKHHPDVVPPAERAAAEEEIKAVNEAYEVLRDPEKRKRYDALGANWKAGDDFSPANGGMPRGGQQVDFDDFSDFFSSVFGDLGVGGGGFRTRQRTRRPARGRDIEAELVLGPEELMAAGKRRLTLGQGRTLDVEIPKNARNGTVLRLTGQGEPGTPPGDLYMHVRVRDDGRYKVEGDDLAMDLPLWPWQAVLGATVRTQVPDGTVDLKVAPQTVAGARLRLKARGLPRADGSRGDLYAVIRIAVPAELSPDERKAYEALRDAARAPADRPAG